MGIFFRLLIILLVSVKLRFIFAIHLEISASTLYNVVLSCSLELELLVNLFMELLTFFRSFSSMIRSSKRWKEPLACRSIFFVSLNFLEGTIPKSSFLKSWFHFRTSFLYSSSLSLILLAKIFSSSSAKRGNLLIDLKYIKNWGD